MTFIQVNKAVKTTHNMRGRMKLLKPTEGSV